jgi:disulfide bond formation protein DsbB
MALEQVTPRQWLLVIAGLCIAGVVAALIGQYGYDMRPCPWCILQRFMFLVIALLCLLGAALPMPRLRRPLAGVSVLVAVLGISAALYQHFVAAKSASCNLTLADKVITALRLEGLVPQLFTVTGSCADAVVSMLGVPYDFWSLALFLVVGTLALRPLARR